MLEVVEEEQQRLVGDVLGEAVSGPERLPGRLQHELRVAQRRERHPEDAVRVARRTRSAAACSASRVLPVPPGPVRVSRRTSSRASSVEHLGELVLAAEERRRRDRQVRAVQALERREVVVAELVDPLGRGQVLQPVLAEVAQPSVLDERRGGGRDEHLAAVAAGRDARRAVHVDADVALLGRGAACPVWSPIRTRIGPTGQASRSPVRGRGERARRRREGDEEGVALRVDLDSAVRGERLAQDPAMLGERLARIAPRPVRASSRVEPSTSVNRKVTVPEGRSRRTSAIMRQRNAYVIGQQCIAQTSRRARRPRYGRGAGIRRQGRREAKGA